MAVKVTGPPAPTIAIAPVLRSIVAMPVLLLVYVIAPVLNELGVEVIVGAAVP